MGLAFCVGCGCSDHDACENEETGEPCSWLAVDYAARSGVCSECPEHLPIWPKDLEEPDAADRQENVGGKGGDAPQAGPGRQKPSEN